MSEKTLNSISRDHFSALARMRIVATVLSIVAIMFASSRADPPPPPCYDGGIPPNDCNPDACSPDAYIYNSPCDPNYKFRSPSPPSVPLNSVDNACVQTGGNYTSKCWGGLNGRNGSPANGFPLNLSLTDGFGPSDYPPRKTDPLMSSSPLVSKDALAALGPSPFRERPMLADTIDLITGQPMLQEVDFELPFGGAVFRHVRTYSENASQFDIVQGQGGDNSNRPAEGTFWDWNGLFWMMGENPILLIDLQYGPIAIDDPSVVSPGQVSHATKRCYLIPDAHHAIPFIYQNGTQNYVAPAWFDAQISHNGVMDINNGNWQQRPSEFYVWLNRKSVRYTFEAHYEDHWLRVKGPAEALELAPVNDPPTQAAPGGNTGNLGVPYYGLLRKIEDRNGNRVEINYCNPGQVWKDEKDHNYDDTQTSCCKECAQECSAKGQINNIKLYRAEVSGSDPEPAVWTLVYTHRAFLPIPDLPAGEYSSHEGVLQHQHALHTIHVYEGDIAVTNGTTCRTIPGSAFCEKTTLGGIDLINHTDVTPGWAIEARYMYSEFGYTRTTQDPNSLPPPRLSLSARSIDCRYYRPERQGIKQSR